MSSFDWSTILPNLPYLLQGMWITLKITVSAICFGLIWGTLLAIMAHSTLTPLRYFAKSYVALFRAIPLLLVLMWFYLIVPNLLNATFNLSPTTDIRLISAIVAFSLFEAAYYSEIIRAGMNQVQTGQKYAARALGLKSYQVMGYIVLPQAFKAMTPLLLTQGIILFQDTSLVYVLSLADFFRSSVNIGQTSGTEIEMVLFSGACYFIICFIASSCVTLMKKRKFL